MYLPLDFYVYAYLRSDGTPYYIGKGSKFRAWQKSKGEVYPPVDPSLIVIVEEGLTDIGALSIERRLIVWYGRKDIGTGILRNKSDGGDGASGAKRSDKTKKLLSESQKGKPRNNSRSKKVCTPEGIFRTISDTAKAYNITEEGVRYRCSVNKNGWHYAGDVVQQTGRRYIENRRKRCTVDGIVEFESRIALVEALGWGKSGFQHPNFRYLPPTG